MSLHKYPSKWRPPENPELSRSPEIACSVCGQAKPQVRNLPYCKDCYYKERYYDDDFCDAPVHEKD
jgi:hypothetical protein